MTRLTSLGRPILPAPAQAQASAGHLIEVPLTAVDRRRVRRRLTAPDGAELLLALPTGTVLMPGSVLETRDGLSYVVAAAPEDVAVISPRSISEAARVAHAVGNLHRDFIEDNGVFLVLWDAPIELLLTRLGVHFERETRPFHGRPSWQHEG
ncbi:urease accessory protein UreE [Deinococcus xinjiangensis]|uniref:Urease accessory protein UreE n=1 Tax=Deinococcus xinjiangensis TaxID=457454 RepID=A0ABP9V893_9DEIO